MPRRQAREISNFTLPFLSVMTGGFGAVVVIFLMIKPATETVSTEDNRDILSSSRQLDYQVRTSEENLTRLQQLLQQLQDEIEDAEERIEELLEETEIKEEDLEEAEEEAEKKDEEVKELEREVEDRESRVASLQQDAQEALRGTTIEIVGEGDRQYLTGMFMGGNYILIALDTSASMLDETIVNVLRRRNMDRERQLRSPKWRRAVRTVEWLAANIPLQSQLQVITFNETAEFVRQPHLWIDASNGMEIRSIVSDLENTVPAQGTNLAALFDQIKTMQPLPDNLFLIVDGFPTMDERRSGRTTVSGRQRLQIFSRSVAKLPSGIPVNIILFPLEGDPLAPAAYWNLAHVTGGTVLSPSRDWP